jgi:Domain of unknown function DUF29
MAAAPKIREFQEKVNEEQANPLEVLSRPIPQIYPTIVAMPIATTVTIDASSSLGSVGYGLFDLLMNAKTDEFLGLTATPRVDEDFHGWLVDQAKALHSRQYYRLDCDGLAEELEAMAAREWREAMKQLKNLLAHLLKWSFQSEELHRRAHSWRRTVREAREELNDLLEDSPGLVTRLKDAFPNVYDRARNKASDDTKLPLERFPVASPWTFDEAMTEDFWPQPATNS